MKMTNRIKKILSLTLVAVMLLALVGCSGGNELSQPADTSSNKADGSNVENTGAEGSSISQDTDIVFGVERDFTTMDPVDTSDTISGSIQRMIMDGLFGFNDEMEVIPLLATDYEANDDASEYVINLREGVSFTDGTPWNAEAAKANFEKLMDKSLGLKRTTLLSEIIDSVEIQDEYTIKITLLESFGAFINTLAHPACVMMSPTQIEAGVDVCAAQPVGTGQYKFVSWTQGESLKIELNKDWWGYDQEVSGGKALVESDAGFKSITFKPVTEAATRVAMLQSGDAQIIFPVPSESVSVVESDTTLNTTSVESIIVRYMFINTAKEKFSNSKVRQAINHAIDKDAYVQVAWDGHASAATSIIAPQVQFYKENSPYEYDIEKAKSLMAEAGYPDGFNTTLMCTNATANTKQAEFIKQQLSAIGIEVEIQSMESALLNEKVQDTTVPGNEAEVELYISGWSPSTGDADWGIRPLIATESFPPNSYNISYYSNPELDGYLKAALETADLDKRAEAYAAAQDIIWEESPLVCLSNDYMIWANVNTISDFKLYPDGAFNVRNAKMHK